MKLLIVAMVGFSAIIAFGIYVQKENAATVAPARRSPVSASRAPAPPTIQLAEPAGRTRMARRAIPEPVSVEPAQPKAVAGLAPVASAPVAPDIADLVSPQVSYQQRQARWKELKKSGQLAQAVVELEQRVASGPPSSDAMTALGEGYYKEAGAATNVRQRAVLAMNADQTLENALNLDPNNWEARFTKAVGMSYWPPELGKGQEVLEQLQRLVRQQEYESSQPQFARTYLVLGEQYQKAGQPEAASQIWQRGAALFPNNTDLAAKLASLSK
jgi:hypothetical protein